MAGTVSTRHFILGLLNQQPMSGYDIKRFLKSLSWLIDSPSFGSLYPALHGLLESGLVTMEVVQSQDKPPRKIYTVTDAGRRALREWMDQPVEADASLKAFVMRLALAEHFSPADLRDYLKQRRAQVASQRRALEEATRAMDGGNDVGERLTFDYGLSLAAAELAWLDGVLARLPSMPSLAEGESHVAMTAYEGQSDFIRDRG